MTFQIDATSPTPKSARDVKLGLERYSREGLETAWLLLAEHDGDLSRAARAMRDDGWDFVQAIELAKAARHWTGNVVLSIPTNGH